MHVSLCKRRSFVFLVVLYFVVFVCLDVCWLFHHRRVFVCSFVASVTIFLSEFSWVISGWKRGAMVPLFDNFMRSKLLCSKVLCLNHSTSAKSCSQSNWSVHMFLFANKQKRSLTLL